MFGLSAELITKGKIGHLKEIRVLAVNRALALRWSDSLETSALEALYSGQFTFSKQLC